MAKAVKGRTGRQKNKDARLMRVREGEDGGESRVFAWVPKCMYGEELGYEGEVCEDAKRGQHCNSN